MTQYLSKILTGEMTLALFKIELQYALVLFVYQHGVKFVRLVLVSFWAQSGLMLTWVVSLRPSFVLYTRLEYKTKDGRSETTHVIVMRQLSLTDY